MAITTSNGNNVDFLGMTADVRENILRSLVGNLKNAAWAYTTTLKTVKDSSGNSSQVPNFSPINQTKQEEINYTTGYTVFQDSDELKMLATDNGIWVKVYPGRGRYSESTDTGDIDYDFCVYLTLCKDEPAADGSNVIEPSTIDPETGECDEPNFARFHLANGGVSKFLTICNADTDASGNDGRNVKVVAAINAAMQQEIKFNRSTKAWANKYTHFALYTHPTEGQIIAWGKLTTEIEVKQADVVPLFEEGKFRLFFPAPSEVETQIEADINDPNL